MAKIIVVLLLFAALPAMGQNGKFDSLAIRVIDRMSDVIGDMKSCQFKLTIASDVPDFDYGLIKRFAVCEVFLSGPDKMLINAEGSNGVRQYKYNGRALALYSRNENNYGVISAPPTTIQTIDSVSSAYGIDFPAADFFYPALADDLMQNSEWVRYVGKDLIDGSEYYHIMASNKDVDIQFWIGTDEFNLPSRFTITYKSQKGSPQYNASFSEWSVNPDLPPAIFEFLPPPGARQVKIMSRHEK